MSPCTAPSSARACGSNEDFRGNRPATPAPQRGARASRWLHRHPRLADWWARNHNRFAGKRIAMFCTGGIRREKASSYLLGQGVPEVLHLKGGMLKYLEEVAPEDSRWQGECFVFDGRVAIGHGLAEGNHSLCRTCGRPVSAEDRTHPDYAEGVNCPACIGEYSAWDCARFAERQRQIELAKARGEAHLGPETADRRPSG